MERGFSKCCVLMKGGKTTKSSRHQYSFNVDKGGSTALLLLFIKTKTEVPK
ncbi:uncharacterized protein PHALS_07202 [Plasmopara halstedii]|uniref:Uncharacterized protein n=1 Tax=Plasmopara halstedii TaxID=4781 RepID=A0A0P1B5I1_PLAHL|nr:uncharacterized protein PHALS_07202 [Plasmopara halstedii]CEG49438.1 hypothetical protein PHALS_07202 [Plasmopara halstedii]|eukprot:XP_024585807.1 hypothetical protein PHALS_07202 [Plasmopara halstedii]